MSSFTSEPRTSFERPLSVSIVGWYLIVAGAFSLYGLLGSFNPIVQETWRAMGINPAIAISVTLLTATANVISGIAILKQHEWGRGLYLVVGVLGIFLSIFVYQAPASGLLIRLASLAVPAYFLFRAPARAYFAGTYARTDEQRKQRKMLASLRASERSDSSARVVFGLLFCLGAGLLLCSRVVAVGMGALSSTVILVVFLLLPSLIGLAIGLVLWGSKRWKPVTGWTLASSGALGALSCLSLASVVGTDAFRSAISSAQVALQLSAGQLLLGGSIGLLLVAAGVLLIDNQYSHDRDTVERALLSE